jgi:hypothetical protein
MTELAEERKAGRLMVGCGGIPVIAEMTGAAVRGVGGELALGMALIAGEEPVLTVEREARIAPMVPEHCGPGLGGVAVFTFVAEPRVVGIVAAADPMAVEAARRGALHHAVAMTVIAGNGEMTAGERKNSSLVKCPRSRSERPVDGVARGAVAPELAAMCILVTGRAVGSDSCQADGRSAA